MSSTSIKCDGLGDWRLQGVARLAAPLPAVYPGGPSHAAGTHLVQTTMIEAPPYLLLGFPTPSAAALALGAAFRAAGRATSLRPMIVYASTVTPNGLAYSIHPDSTSVLFDFFEATMAAANSSFQAIEAFANERIAAGVRGCIAIKRKRKNETLSAEEIERNLSTEEKLGTILPKHLNLVSIKGTREWELFLKIKAARDGSTHFKSGDQYPLATNGKAAKGSLYDILFNSKPEAFPVDAVRILWAVLGNADKPRWLSHLAEVYVTRE